eukprot:CFRG5737T1
MPDIRWLPLESNPDVMNNFVHALGVESSWGFHDVYGLDAELLAFVPQPTTAVLLLFPVDDEYEKFFVEEQKRIDAEGQYIPRDHYFIKQVIRNACGTIGLLNALGNNTKRIKIDGALGKFFEDTTSMTPIERADFLTSAESISVAHHESAHEGQTKPPALDAVVLLHFVAFVEVDGELLELDGRKPYPINHGKTTSSTLLQDSVKVIQSYIDRSKDNVNFNVVALAPMN